MFRNYSLGFVVLLLLFPGVTGADDAVFSGPQVGEKLPSLKVKGVFDDLAGKELDLIERADGKAVALIFVHERTRPAFGLTNAIMKYAVTRSKDGLDNGVIFLTDDPTPTLEWMNRVKNILPKGVTHCISTDGVEGPGSYGLNRNVALTVLIGKEGKVTANFALVQPSLTADGPKILKAIVEATGGGKVPSIAEFAGLRYTGQNRKKKRGNNAEKRPNQQNDPQLSSLLRAVINKQASEEDVKKAAAEVEAYITKNEVARRQLGRITNTVVNGGKLSNYGTEAAQVILKRWSKEFGPPARDQKRGAGDKKRGASDEKRGASDQR
jgi:hypothetical protein